MGSSPTGGTSETPVSRRKAPADRDAGGAHIPHFRYAMAALMATPDGYTSGGLAWRAARARDRSTGTSPWACGRRQSPYPRTRRPAIGTARRSGAAPGPRPCAVCARYSWRWRAPYSEGHLPDFRRWPEACRRCRRAVRRSRSRMTAECLLPASRAGRRVPTPQGGPGPRTGSRARSGPGSAA